MERIQDAYRADTFREDGHRLIDQLADYLEALHERPGEQPAMPYQRPNELWSQWREAPPANIQELFARVLQQSVAVHHPQYMGHQISPPVPVAALAGLLGDFVNNGMGVYEMGMAGTVLERLVVERMARELGFGPEAGGFLTSGGTLANLTALLTARSLKVPERVWTEGQREPLALMVSAEAHYCVDRAARIMGWGSEGVIKVPTDDNYCLRTDLLPECLEAARQRGRRVIAIVGSACTTATGSFDDLEALADFAEAHDLWLHVDGAHGAALALSPEYRHRVAGLERADSVAMDFHKMLTTPSITTALLYKRQRDTYATFQQRAAYLLEWEQPDNWYDLARRTFECTKLMLGLKAYAILATQGVEFWRDYVTRVCRTTEQFAAQVRQRKSLKLAMEPQTNIICFRYHSEGMTEEALNHINRSIRQELLEDGSFYIVQTLLDQSVYLRCTLTNPFTTETHIAGLLEIIEKIGAKLRAGQPSTSALYES